MGGAGGQTVDTRSPFGVPLKFFGYHCSKELCKKLVASKGTAAGRPFFFADGIGISLIFFICGSYLIFKVNFLPGGRGDLQAKSTVLYYVESITKENRVGRTKSPGGFRNLSAAQKKFRKVDRKSSRYFIHSKFARSETASYTTSTTCGCTIPVW